jgi:hypothetical protein
MSHDVCMWLFDVLFLQLVNEPFAGAVLKYPDLLLIALKYVTLCACTLTSCSPALPARGICNPCK